MRIRNWTFNFASAVLVFLGLGLSLPASGQASTAVTLDVTGAAFTVARAINNVHGFIGMNSGAVAIDFPSAVFTEVGGINNNGDLTGTYVDSGGNVHAFARSAAGEFTSVDVPGAAMQLAGTNGWAINDAGRIGAFAGKSKSTALDFSQPPADLHGFVISADKFVTVNAPDGMNTCIFGLNNASQAVGQYNTPDGGLHGFVMQVNAAQ